MRTSITKYLNQYVTLIKIDTGARTSTGARTKSEVTVAAYVKARITTNKGTQSQGGVGTYTTSTHLVFILTQTDIEAGYYIKDTSGQYYKINYVDKLPGGVSTNHYQVYCDRVDGVSDV